MTFYGEFQAVPGRVVALLNVLFLEPVEVLSFDDVKKLLRPSSLTRGRRGAVASEEESQDAPTQEVLNAAISLGLVRLDSAGKPGQRSYQLENTAIARLKDASDANCEAHRLVQERAACDESFSRICAWLLLRHPESMPQTLAALSDTFKADGFDADEYKFKNQAQLQNFFYWSDYVGLTWRFHDELVISDGSRWLDRHLDKVLSPGEEQPVETFLSRIGQLCPALDGGSSFQFVVKQVADPPPERVLSPGISFALRHLQNVERLEFFAPNDAREFYQLSDGARLTAVRRPGNSSTQVKQPRIKRP
jgi:hypothetical protein